MNNPTIHHYHLHAQRYQTQYDSLEAHRVHQQWHKILVQLSPGRALDVGAGSGRDARWLANMGWQVTAVEPAQRLRELAQRRTPSSIHWLSAALPDLRGIDHEVKGFDLILLSAVWMHLPPTERPRAMHRLGELLAPKGHLIMTLRYGPSDSDRPMYPVNAEELKALALQQKMILQLCSNDRDEDQLQRGDITWQTVDLRHSGSPEKHDE